MRKCWLLTKVQLLGLFGLNRLRHAGTGVERRRMLLLGVAALVLTLILEGYLILMAFGLLMLGMGHLLPSLLLMAASIITLVFTLIKCNGTLFGFQDYDRVMSLPVSSAAVIGSRLLTLYLSNLLFTFLVMAPGLILYGVHAGVAFAGWVILALSILLAPLLPMIAATLLGAVITAISVRFRHKNILTAILSIVATVGLLVGIMSANYADLSGIMDFGGMLSRAIGGAYPLAGWFASAFIQSDWGAFLLYAALSILPAFLFVWALSKLYAGINAALFAHHARRGYTIVKLKGRSKGWALYQKEFRRLLGSPVYLLNCCIGAVLMVMAAIALVSADSGQIHAFLAESGMGGVSLAMLPAFLCLFSVMICTTCVSMNMEGKARWVIFAAPVSPRAIFRAKIYVNLSVSLPAVLIAGVCCAIAAQATVWQGILMVALPAAYACFIAVAGIAVNLKFPKYDWMSEQQAVKQSLSMGVAIGVGFLACIPPIVLTVVFPGYIVPIQIAIIALIGILTWRIDRRLAKVRLSMA